MGGKHNAKRILRTSKAPWIAGSLAVLATGVVVSAGVVASSDPGTFLAAADGSGPAASLGDAVHREPVLSRGGGRQPVEQVQPGETLTPLSPVDQALQPQVVRDAIRAAKDELWTTAPLNLWTRPDAQAEKVGVVAEGKKVLVTGRAMQGREEIVFDGESRWVTAGYLSEDKPLGVGAGLSNAPCPDSSVEEGLQPSTILVYRSVCHAFPQVTEYGGWAPRTEHNTGNALDVMVYGDKALGDAIAQWAYDHAAELNLYDIIWYDRIWTPVRASEGWRDYGDHGSPTANHMDHVHIGTN